MRGRGLVSCIHTYLMTVKTIALPRGSIVPKISVRSVNKSCIAVLREIMNCSREMESPSDSSFPYNCLANENVPLMRCATRSRSGDTIVGAGLAHVSVRACACVRACVCVCVCV